MRRPWTEEESEILRRSYGAETTSALADRLERSVSSVYQHARLIGISTAREDKSPEFFASIRELNAQGWADQPIAKVLGVSRKTATMHRKRLGLPSRAYGDLHRKKVADAARKQLNEAGLASMGELRVQVWHKRAIEAGWPPDLSPREVQILESLSGNGPMTRQEIVDAIGMKWLGSRKSLRSRGRGSDLANLMAKGLVFSLGKIATGKGKGRSRQVYSLSLDCERGGCC